MNHEISTPLPKQLLSFQELRGQQGLWYRWTALSRGAWLKGLECWQETGKDVWWLNILYIMIIWNRSSNSHDSGHDDNDNDSDDHNDNADKNDSIDRIVKNVMVVLIVVKNDRKDDNDNNDSKDWQPVMILVLIIEWHFIIIIRIIILWIVINTICYC